MDALQIVAMKQDQTKVYSSYIPMMNIIGEIPSTYANIDPSDFDNILNHPRIIEDEVKILELNSVYIDQLGAML